MYKRQVGHNVAFDVAITRRNLARSGAPGEFGNVWYDTLDLSRRCLLYTSGGKQRPFRAFARPARVRGEAAQFSASPWALRAMQKRPCLKELQQAQKQDE